MAAKSNKNVIIGIVATMFAIVAIIVGVLVLKKAREDNGVNKSDNNGASQVNYSKVDAVIEINDYEAMYEQAKSIQNGEMVGKIVRIDGIVSHPLTKYSIVEMNESGEKIGTEFEIEGASSDAYPEDGERVIITGEVIEKSPMYFIIKTTPEYVEIIDGSEAGETEELEKPE